MTSSFGDMSNPYRLFALNPRDGSMSRGKCWACSELTQIDDFGLILPDGAALRFVGVCQPCAEALRSRIMNGIDNVRMAARN